MISEITRACGFVLRAYDAGVAAGVGPLNWKGRIVERVIAFPRVFTQPMVVARRVREITYLEYGLPTPAPPPSPAPPHANRISGAAASQLLTVLTGTTPAGFVERFRRKHKRRPRILHIGNIANNAYLNAKLMNEAGCDCDVICYDYYHIMGCPEWEDADIDGDVGDHFRPDWSRLNLNGFERPRWFVQGPQAQCLDYLIARRDGDAVATEELWDMLGAVNHTKAPPTMDAPRDFAPRAFVQRVSAAIFNLRFQVSLLRGPRDLFVSVWQWLDPGNEPSVATVFRAWLLALGWMAIFPVAATSLLLLRRLQRPAQRMLVSAQPTLASWMSVLVRTFAEHFPGREDQLTIDDILPFASLTGKWKRLFGHYDVIVAYSTDGFLPLLANRSYCAFEHGTLRELPFRGTGEGRRTALSYAMADHVFVTNFDCLDHARLLAPGRNTLINHPFDEDHGLRTSGWQEQRAELCAELNCEFVFFFPTRHDWVKGTGYADKGNDVFLRGLAALGASGISVGVVCCEWGKNVAESRALLAELGMTAHAKWIVPLPTVRFERMARAAHCVVDQFILGSFGGVMFKAMAVGAPVLTYLDEQQLLKQYPVIPPVVNCRTPGQIVEMMTPLLRDPQRLAGVGAAAREWMKQYHSKHDTISRQARVFESLLQHDR